MAAAQLRSFHSRVGWISFVEVIATTMKTIFVAIALMVAQLPGQPCGPLQRARAFAAAVANDPRVALSYIQDGAVFFLGDFSGPTTAAMLIERARRCSLLSVKLAPSDGHHVEVLWNCVPTGGSRRRVLRVELDVSDRITGGDGGYIEYG